MVKYTSLGIHPNNNNSGNTFAIHFHVASPPPIRAENSYSYYFDKLMRIFVNRNPKKNESRYWATFATSWYPADTFGEAVEVGIKEYNRQCCKRGDG